MCRTKTWWDRALRATQASVRLHDRVKGSRRHDRKSQRVRVTPSWRCSQRTVSMESAIRSRDWRLKLIPSVPMEIPSLTPMVLKR